MTAVIGGDGLHVCIGAASILAKVHRDQLMVDMDLQFPAYGFAKHKGYPTAQHMQALRQHGPTVHHRNSFRPVREARDHLQAVSAVAIRELLS
jgi:ribonuclease HII